ncbi:hypothetical protein [Streptomyces sp. DB-54]
MPGKSARREALTDQRYARITEKADAIQARQRREDEEISVVLSKTSVATLVLTVLLTVGLVLGTDVPLGILQGASAVLSALPGVITLILRFKNRD